MNHEHSGADFDALTTEEMTATTGGGEDSFAHMIGNWAGFAWSVCSQYSIAYQDFIHGVGVTMINGQVVA